MLGLPITLTPTWTTAKEAHKDEWKHMSATEITTWKVQSRGLHFD